MLSTIKFFCTASLVPDQIRQFPASQKLPAFLPAVLVIIDLVVPTTMNQSFGSSQISNFEKKEIIGKGAYGEVYKAVDRRTKETVALKKILIEMDAEGFPSSSIR